jgi:hypothetical protein
MSDTIFVSVASYRDPECVSTLEYIFNNADNPKNIYVGVCQQNDMSDNTTDMECVLPEGNYANNIRLMRLKHYEAKGPTWARYLCATLYRDEDYFFQIDSHTKLIPGWDTKCINMMKHIKSSGLSDNPVLSHYPAAWESFENNDKKVTRICKSFFNEQGMISFEGAQFIDTDKVAPSPYVAGGFLFCEGKMLKDVPFDPTLDYLFVGEEIMHSARIWTAGYDIFTPNENIAFHEYTRAEKPKIWTDKRYTDKEAFEKVKQLIGLKEQNKNLDDYKYGLGKVRSLEEYYNFAGIDLQNKKVNKDFCRKDQIDNGKHITREDFDNINDSSNSKLLIFIIIVAVIIILWKYYWNNES